MVAQIGIPGGEVQIRAAKIWRIQQEINAKLNMEELSLFEKVGILEALKLQISHIETEVLKEMNKRGDNIEIH